MMSKRGWGAQQQAKDFARQRENQRRLVEEPNEGREKGHGYFARSFGGGLEMEVALLQGMVNGIVARLNALETQTPREPIPKTHGFGGVVPEPGNDRPAMIYNAGGYSPNRRMDGSWESVARFLWCVLDDIDSAMDAHRPQHTSYTHEVQRLCERRFEVSRSDGYKVEFAVAEDVKDNEHEH